MITLGKFPAFNYLFSLAGRHDHWWGIMFIDTRAAGADYITVI